MAEMLAGLDLNHHDFLSFLSPLWSHPRLSCTRSSSERNLVLLGRDDWTCSEWSLCSIWYCTLNFLPICMKISIIFVSFLGSSHGIFLFFMTFYSCLAITFSAFCNSFHSWRKIQSKFPLEIYILILFSPYEW